MIILVKQNKKSGNIYVKCFQKLHGYPVAVVLKYSEAIKHLSLRFNLDNTTYLNTFFSNWRNFIMNYIENEENALIRYKYPNLVSK